jgi:hypothetical protein
MMTSTQKDKSSSTLSQYLSQFRRQKGQLITNTKIPDPARNLYGGSYHIPDEKYDEFLQIYFREVFECGHKEHLTEAQLEDNGPIAVDIDLRYDPSVTTRKHDKSHIDDLILVYLEEIQQIFSFRNGQYVKIFVFEKPEVNRVAEADGKPAVTKDGIHMIIGLQADRPTQEYLRERVIPSIAVQWDDIPITTPWSSVFDEGITKGTTPWQLVGSQKPNHMRYELIRASIWSFDASDGQWVENGIPFEDKEDFRKLFPLLSVRYPNHPQFPYTAQYVQQRLASKPVVSQSQVVGVTVQEDENVDGVGTSAHSPSPDDRMQYPPALIRELIEEGLLDKQAEGGFNGWINICFSLKNTYTEEAAWELFEQFSARCKAKFDEGECRPQQFDAAKPRTQEEKKRTIFSVIWQVKQNDPVKAKEIMDRHKHLQRNKRKRDDGQGDGSYRFAADDTEAAQMICDDMKGMIRATADGRIFMKMEKQHIWVHDDSKLNTLLLDKVLTSDICRTNKDQEKVPYSQNLSAAKKIVEVVMNQVRSEAFKNLDGDDLYLKFHTTTHGRLCFRDGVLDFIARRFYRWDEVDFEYLTTRCIPYDFAEYFENPNLDVVNEVYTKIYRPLYGEKVNIALNFLSRAIAGHSEDKNWATYTGNRNSGKGVQYDNMEETFGKDIYVAPFELQHIMYSRNTHTEEVSRKNYWAINLEFTRLAISQETPAKDDKLKLNSKVFKKLAGGGDWQTARRNYDRYDTVFKLDTTFLFMGNTPIESDNVDVFEHRLEFTSVLQYKTQAEIDIEFEKGLPEKAAELYRVKDPEIKNMCKTMDWKLATVYLLFQRYIPESVLIPSLADDEESNLTIRAYVLETFDFTYDEEDIILCQFVYDHLQSESTKKITLEMAALGVTKKRCKNRRADESLRDKWCFYGIKIKEEPEPMIEEVAEGGQEAGATA